MSKDEGPLPTRARALFDRSVADMPVATTNRLRLARRAALAGATGAADRPGVRWQVPLGATAAVLLALGWWRSESSPGVPAVPSATHAPVAAAPAGPAPPMLADEDDAELYAWLAEAPVASDQHGNGAL